MANKILTELERFEASYKEAQNGCWEWQKFVDDEGYGKFRTGSYTRNDRKQVRAHRWAYEWFVGKIPEGLTIDHLCRNHRCVNPAHLEAVTSAENTKRGARANATHCKYGHPLSGDNLKFYKSEGYVKRACRECARKYQAAYAKANNYLYQKRYVERRRSSV